MFKVAEQFKGAKGKDLYRELIRNKSDIFSMKRVEAKIADSLFVPYSVTEKLNKIIASKEFAYSNDVSKGELVRSIVANSYYWLDSHDDVHLNNLFAKSIQEQGKFAPHLHDHIFQIDAKVGQVKGYEEKYIDWKDLSIDKEGQTMILLLNSVVKKSYNEKIYEEYLTDQVNQHSVRMSYVKLSMAVNDKDYEEEYKEWNLHIEKIGNKAQAEAQGYFFPIYEAKLYETSAVLLGSNELTPTLGGSSAEPSKDTQKFQPDNTTDYSELVKRYKENLYN